MNPKKLLGFMFLIFLLCHLDLGLWKGGGGLSRVFEGLKHDVLGVVGSV